MTKKDFIAIAHIIKHATVFENNAPLDTMLDKKTLVEKLGKYFLIVNPRFNPAKFAKACKIG